MSEQQTRTSPQVAVPTVVWGVVVLVIAGIAFAGSVVDLREVTGAGIVWAVIGVGALLVVAAVVGAVARAAGSTSGTGHAESTGSADTASTDRLTDL